MSSTAFQGTSALTLDGKGRITIPVRQRDLLRAPPTDGRVTITADPDGCLNLFPRPVWEGVKEKLMQLPHSASRFRRIFVGSAVDVMMDNGERILIPPELRQYAKLDKDVLLIGHGNKLELWDAQTHREFEAAVLAGGMPEEIASLVF